MGREEYDVVIVGSGFAGAATAYHLSKHFRGSILILEREQVPGVHASGRNAGLILQSVADPAIRSVVAASARQYARLSSELGFVQSGSLLLGSPGRLEGLREPERVESLLRKPEAVHSRLPLLDGHAFEAALETPGDGVIDIWALLQHYLAGARARGVTLRLSCEVREISGSAPFRIETNRGPLLAARLINAAGGWASRLATMAGAAPLPLTPWKRHLFALENIRSVHSDWPFVWNLEPEFYFRPDAKGLLFSLCDEEKDASLEPVVSSDVSERAAELVWKQLPALREATERDVWSCFRTKAPDGRFSIGWDPRCDGFFWVAGLGGHGVGSSWEVGRIAASIFLGEDCELRDSFAPERLAQKTYASR
jgi:D-arginine dehydrogenase